MPLIEQNPAWSGILSGLITAYGMSQGMKNAKQEKQRQQQIDAQNAALANAQLAQTTANTNKTTQETAQEKLLFPQQQRAAGINPANNQPFNYGYTPQQLTKGLTNQDLNQRAMFLGMLAAKAQAEGSTDAAQNYGKQALSTMQMANTAQKERLAYQQFSEKLLMDAAQRAHLSNQDNVSFQRLSLEAARLQNEVNNGSIRAAEAEANLKIRAQELGISQARLGIEKQRLQMDLRTGGKAPPGYSQVMENLRANANFKGLDPNSQTIVTQSLASGRPMGSIISTMQKLANGSAHNPNVTQDQAQAILNALTSSP